MHELTTLTGGIAFGESPRWHGGRLWFSDWAAGELSAVDLEGNRELVWRHGSFPFCFDWLPDGRLLVVSGREGLVLRQEPGGTMVTHADLRKLSPGPWNEIVVGGGGTAYVNTIAFEFPGGEYRPGHVARVPTGGPARIVATDVAFPNGMALSIDGTTLLVAESYAHCLTAFDVQPGGDLTNRRVWATTGDHSPDGICLDAEGAAWYADVGSGMCVRVAEGGEVLDRIEVGEACFSCALGGPDGRTLFIVTSPWPPNPGTRAGRVVMADVGVPAAGTLG